MALAIAIAAIVTAGAVGYLVGRRVPTSGPAPVTADSDNGGSARVRPASSEGERVSVAELRDAIDRIEVGVLICNSLGDVMFRNRRAGELAGTHVGLVVDDQVSKIVASTLTSGSSEQIVELHGPPKRALEITSSPMTGGGVVVELRDVSERVRIDAMRTDFVANISHELRTPIGAIAVLAEALEDVDDIDTVNTLAGRLVAEAHRAVGTVDDLMELSLIEVDQVEAAPIDLGRLVDEAIGRGRSLANGRELEITTIGIDRPLSVVADRTQLLSALGNLVENAVKYSYDGGLIQICVRRDARWLELIVADQGVGIPARDLDRVFERFYRVDKARGRSTGGSGLGLSIVRHVAHNHGGDISVSSQEGEGSTFVLRLPARLIVDDHDDARGECDDDRHDDRADPTSETEET